MEERRERVIRLSSDSTYGLSSKLRVRFSEACYGFSQKEQGSNRVVTKAAVGYERLNYATVKA